MTRTSTLLVTVLAGLGLSAAAARAQGSDELAPAAQQHLDSGVAAFTAHDYATASKELEAAYAIDPKPQLLYTWAQAKRLEGACADAIGLYRRYLDADTSEAQKAAAKIGIDLCTAELAKKTPLTTPPAPTPVPAPVPAPSPPPAPPRADAPVWYRNKLGDGLLVGGVVSVGLGIGFLVAASSSKDRADHATQRDDFGSAIDQATTRRQIGFVATGVGVALVAGAIVTFVTGSAHEHSSVALGTDGRGVFVAGGF